MIVSLNRIASFTSKYPIFVTCFGNKMYVDHKITGLLVVPTKGIPHGFRRTTYM